MGNKWIYNPTSFIGHFYRGPFSSTSTNEMAIKPLLAVLALYFHHINILFYMFSWYSSWYASLIFTSFSLWVIMRIIMVVKCIENNWFLKYHVTDDVLDAYTWEMVFTTIMLNEEPIYYYHCICSNIH